MGKVFLCVTKVYQWVRPLCTQMRQEEVYLGVSPKLRARGSTPQAEARARALTHVSEKYTNQFLVNIGWVKVSEVIGDLYDKFKRPLTTLEKLVSTII